MTDPARWTTVADITSAVQRRWSSGELLRALAARASFPVIDLPLRGPVAADLGDHLDAARAWVRSIHNGARGGEQYAVITATIGGRHAGRTEVPSRVVIDSFASVWRLLGVSDEVADFRQVLDQSAGQDWVAEWVTANPLRAIALAPDWSRLLVARQWLHAHRNSGLYLRQISAPGVDTKFVEAHRTVLAELLGVPSATAAFATGLGMAAKPAMVRMRFDPALLRLPAAITEATFRADEIGAAEVRPRKALIVENEITYLSVPVPEGGVVLWGRGYSVDEPASLEWLSDLPVDYWGDLDTHGFAILNRVRAHLPQTRSILMDRETLLAHEERWGTEDRPSNGALPLLGEAESALYSDLVSDRYGPAVRLEQERIDWAWAAARVTRDG